MLCEGFKFVKRSLERKVVAAFMSYLKVRQSQFLTDRRRLRVRGGYTAEAMRRVGCIAYYSPVYKAMARRYQPCEVSPPNERW